MIGATKILGADLSAQNITGNNYVPSLQVSYGGSTGTRAKLYKVVVSNLTAADVYLWIFDLAAGNAGTSAAPRVVELCPGGAGLCTTLDLSGGKPFGNGIFLVLSTTAPADATTTPTAVANNAAILDVDYRLE